MLSIGSGLVSRQARRLVLISLDWTRPKDPPLSLGQASILANTTQHNIHTISKSWSVNNPVFDPNQVTEFIMQHASSTTDVALGAFVWNESYIQSILDSLKKHRYPGRIILGGPQVSYVKSGIEKFYPQADIFIRGYAEKAIVELMSLGSLTPSIKGVHYAGQPDSGVSAMVDFDNLPSPYLTGIIKPQRFIRIETQRGCPFKCSFCQHRESDVTMQRRQFPLLRSMQEAEWIARNPIVQDVAVLDPTFNSGPNYLKFLDKLSEEKFTGKLALQCRIEMVKQEFLEAVVRLNKTSEVVLEFGLQSTNIEEQRIIDRPSNMKAIEKILDDVHNRNIKSEVSLIFGLPNQTVDSFKRSIDFCVKHKVPVVHAFPLMLLRGTPLYNRKAELGLVESNEVASMEIDRVQTDIPHVISSKSFKYDDWKTMARMAEDLELNYNQKKPKNMVS